MKTPTSWAFRSSHKEYFMQILFMSPYEREVKHITNMIIYVYLRPWPSGKSR